MPKQLGTTSFRQSAIALCMHNQMNSMQSEAQSEHAVPMWESTQVLPDLDAVQTLSAHTSTFVTACLQSQGPWGLNRDGDNWTAQHNTEQSQFVAGTKDVLVLPELNAVADVWPTSLVVEADVRDMPGVWLSADHQVSSHSHCLFSLGQF